MDPPAQPRQLAWFSLDGKKISTVGDPDPATIIDLSLSPEGKRAIAQIEGPDGPQLWTIDLARGVRSRFTVGIKAAFTARWSPDGKRVAFGAAASDNSWSVQLKDADGGSPGKAIFSSQDSVAPTDWSPDGLELAFATQSSVTKSADIGILSMNGRLTPSLRRHGDPACCRSRLLSRAQTVPCLGSDRGAEGSPNRAGGQLGRGDETTIPRG
jgi:hypothetical protein